MSYRLRLFLALWIPAMTGVLSFLLVDIEGLIAVMPQPAGQPPVEMPPFWLLKLASVLQPAILTTLAVIIGMWLSPIAGLHAPVAEAFASRSAVFPKLKPQIIPGVVTGLLAGCVIAGSWAVARTLLPIEFVSRVEEFNRFIPAAVRIMYGGFTEEALLRWGVMTAGVVILYKLLQRDGGQPRPVWYLTSIFVSALIFGAGHLPVASALGVLTPAVAAYVVAANSVFGIAAGFLYWKRGLESAIIAHITAHLLLITLLYLSA